MFHIPGRGLEGTDLFFEWDLGLTVFPVGLGEEQLTRNNNNAGKILLIILINYFYCIYNLPYLSGSNIKI